jgi:F-type H+-transporting ATPase subunit epsilon
MSPKPSSSFHLKVITPKLLLVEAEVDEVSIPSLDGSIGILPGHRPLMTALGQGTITYRQGKDEESFAVRGGTAEILPDRVIVFTELSQEDAGSDG